LSTGTDKPNYKYLTKLIGTSILLQILGWNISVFPFFIFFAIVPLIGLTRYAVQGNKISSFDYFVALFAAFLIPAFSKMLIFQPSLFDFLASLGGVLAFVFWFWSAKIGSLRSFYLFIFWLGTEYVFIFIKPSVFNHLPLAAFRMWGESFTWIKYAGFQGPSLWYLLVNFLFANAIFDEKGIVRDKLKKYHFLLAAFVGVGPMIASMLFYTGNPPGNLTPFFSNPSAYFPNFNYNLFYSYYLDYGEYLGKTGFWISILILMSLFVKNLLSK